MWKCHLITKDEIAYLLLRCVQWNKHVWEETFWATLFYVCLCFVYQRSAKIQKKASEYVEVTNELKVHSLNLDSPTQDFSLGTACFRMDNQDPSTPEMPDLSSVTQEICKVSCWFPFTAHLILTVVVLSDKTFVLLFVTYISDSVEDAWSSHRAQKGSTRKT